MKFNRYCLPVAAIAAIAAASPAFAQQTTGDIRGRVVDQSGNPVAGARVTITHTPSGTTVVRNTNGQGVFTARGLRPGGPYIIIVDKDRYARSEVDDVTIDVANPNRADVILTEENAARREGFTDEVITIANRAHPGAPGGTELSRDAIDTVTTVNRDVRDLLRRDPLATLNTGGNRGVSIAGQLPQANRLTIDGVSAKDDFGINTGGLPTSRGPVSLDAIEQVSIAAAPFDVEEGNFLGGAVNVVLKSGTNNFEGTGFWETNREFLAGNRIAGLDITAPFRGRTFGGVVSGPIIRDRLFFSGSYEEFSQTDVTGVGPTADRPDDPIFSSQRNIAASALDAFNQSVEQIYGYAPLGIPLTTPVSDRKWHAKLDWNINDQHKASFTYRSARDSQVNRPSPAGVSQSLADGSYFYELRQADTSYTGQVNSDWSSRLSTEIRFSHRTYDRFQDPLAAGDNPDGLPASQASSFAEVLVCADAISAGSATSCSSGAPNFSPTLAFGPDRFRHANLLLTTSNAFKATATYTAGVHQFKAGYERQFNNDSNLIVPNSQGIYYFDSIADFEAGRANSLIYSNALSGVPVDASADFAFSINTAYVQDTIDLTQKLSANIGLRYDLYTSDSGPQFSDPFATRYGAEGIVNDAFIGGRDVFQPRASIEFRPDAKTKITAGFGLYSALISDVLALSAAVANDGVRTNTIQITRTPTGFALNQGAPSLFNAAIGSAALDIFARPQPFDLFNIPGEVQGFLAGGGAPTTASTASIDPDFDIPSNWKGNFNISRTADLGFFGEDWRFGFNFLYQLTKDTYVLRDLRLVPNGVLPDGRPRYIGDNNTTPVLDAAAPGTVGDSGFDIQIGSSSLGASRAFTWTAAKSFGSFLDVDFAYSRQNVNSVLDGQVGGTTAQSQYSGTAVFDPNAFSLGTSSQEVKNSLKYSFTFHHNFFSDLKTTLSLFGERRSGRPYSYTFGDPAATSNIQRSAVFGALGSSRFLFFVPDFASDADPTDLQAGSVFFNNATTRDAVQNFVVNGELAAYQGEIAPRNAFRSPANNRIDLTFTQELPFFFGHRPEVYFGVENLLNLISSKWGAVREFGSQTRIVNVECATSAGATGGAANAACTNYLYSAANFSSNPLNGDADTPSINLSQSRWTAAIGVRYHF